MPKKKSTSSLRKLSRIQALETWTNVEALRRYVYVLLPQYYSQDTAEGVLFYACVDDRQIEIRPETVEQFFADHAHRTFITYDGLAFHLACIKAFNGSRENQAAIWRLSRDCRLWDVALLEMRIQYAHEGFDRRIDGIQGFQTLLKKRVKVDPVQQANISPLSLLRKIFKEQIHWALENLPIFNTCLEKGNIPEPTTTDEYCDLFDKKDKGKLEIISPFRRRDMILTGMSGPFGNGLDVQAAIAAYHIRTNIDNPCLSEHSQEFARNLFNQKSIYFGCRELETCFRWTKPERGIRKIQLKGDGNLDIITKNWRKRLYSAATKERQSFISAPHTYPLKNTATISLRSSDWISYRSLGSPISDWIELDVATAIMKAWKGQSFITCTAFPSFRCRPLDLLAEMNAKPVLKPSEGKKFITLHWEKSPQYALVCSVFSAYLISPRDCIDDVIDIKSSILSKLKNSYEIDGMVMSPDRILIDFLTCRSLDEMQRIVEATLDSFRLLEHAAAYRERLLRIDHFFYESECNGSALDALYSAVLSCVFAPFIDEGECPFSPIPVPGTTDDLGKVSKIISSFKRSVNMDELMLGTVALHFATLASMSREEILPETLLRECNGHGWSFINRLHQNNYSHFFLKERFDSFAEIRSAANRKGQETVVQEMQRSNAVSSTGRLGRPIQYYEWIDTDARQFLEDLKVSVTFSLLAEGLDVVFSTDSQIVIQATESAVKAVSDKVKQTAENSLLATLKTVFPSSCDPNDIFSHFIKEQIAIVDSDSWPVRSNAEPIFDSNHQDSGTTQALDIVDDYVPCDGSEKYEILREARKSRIRPRKKRSK